MQDLIQQYNRWLVQALDTLEFDRKEPQHLYSPMDYMLKGQAKRLRPLLVLFSYGLFRDDVEEIALPALSVELFHSFTLIHDDVMDHADMRRGRPSVHTKWGLHGAILSGDAMLIEGYKLLVGVADDLLPVVLRTFNACAIKVCAGQQMDMDFEKQVQVEKAAYLEMARLKTGALLGFCLELGALLARASQAKIVLLRELGEHIGMMFQITDDILDVYGQSSTLGKPIGGDIVGRKKTFLLIRAMEKAQDDTYKQLQHCMQDDTLPREDKIKTVKGIYNKLHIRRDSLDYIEHLYAQCVAYLDALAIDKERKHGLRFFIQHLMDTQWQRLASSSSSAAG